MYMEGLVDSCSEVDFQENLAPPHFHFYQAPPHFHLNQKKKQSNKNKTNTNPLGEGQEGTAKKST